LKAEKRRVNTQLSERKYALFGILGPLIAIFFVLVSIIFSPWFSWWNNALSDLGNSDSSEAAPLFNFGLLLTGFFMIIYSITAFRNHAKYTSYFLVIVGLFLQLVATFDEVYGSLHYLVSVLFFVALAFASIIYAAEKRSVVSFAALILGFGSWVLYWMGIYSAGIAVPEAISSMAVFAWIMLSALRIYFDKSTT
jgi:hypothetical membrane protein